MIRTCPHCHKRYNRMPAHAVVCLQRPGIKELVRQLLERLDAPGVARTVKEYDAEAKAYNKRLGIGLLAPSAHALLNVLASWGKVCDWVELTFVLTPPRVNDKYAAATERAIAETAAAIEADAELRAAWEVRGLPVGRIYTSLKDKRVYCVLR
jgi:hypothetical protein